MINGSSRELMCNSVLTPSAGPTHLQHQSKERHRCGRVLRRPRSSFVVDKHRSADTAASAEEAGDRTQRWRRSQFGDVRSFWRRTHGSVEKSSKRSGSGRRRSMRRSKAHHLWLRLVTRDSPCTSEALKFDQRTSTTKRQPSKRTFSYIFWIDESCSRAQGTDFFGW